MLEGVAGCYEQLHSIQIYVALCCSVLQCVAVRCSVLQCVAESYEQLRSIQIYPPAPMNYAKICMGWPRQDASWELVPHWYTYFPPDRFLSGGNEEANYVE